MDLNHRQADYDSAALPTELHSLKKEEQKIVKPAGLGKAIIHSFSSNFPPKIFEWATVTFGLSLAVFLA